MTIVYLNNKIWYAYNIRVCTFFHIGVSETQMAVELPKVSDRSTRRNRRPSFYRDYELNNNAMAAVKANSPKCRQYLSFETTRRASKCHLACIYCGASYWDIYCHRSTEFTVNNEVQINYVYYT